MQIRNPRSIPLAPILGSRASTISTAAYPSETDPPVVIRHFPAGARGKKGEPATEPAMPAAPARRARRHVVSEPIDHRPTAERELHAAIRTEKVAVGDGKLPVAVRRVVGAIGVLWKKEEISNAMHTASGRWYRDYATGVLGGRDPVEGWASTGADAHDAQIARLDAVTRCAAARGVIGFCGEVRLKALLIDELSFAAAADRLMPGKAGGERLIRAQVLLLLEQLAEHYAEVDRRRRAAEDRKRLTDCTGTE